MFDKRLMKVCPESRKYIIGNVILQWFELILNALIFYEITGVIQLVFFGDGSDPTGTWYDSVLTGNVRAAMRDELYGHIFRAAVMILCAVPVRAVVTGAAVKMSYLASKTVKRRMRGMIYEKLLKLGSRYRESVTTAELVQESVEGVDQLESYFGQYVPQFFYAFLAPVTLFIMFGILGSWSVGAMLLICVPLIPGAIMTVQKIAKKLLSKYWGQYTRLGSTFLENLQGMTTLKTYSADGFKNEQMNKESENFRFVTMKVLTMQLNSIIIMDFFTYGGAAVGIAMTVSQFGTGLSVQSALFMILMSAEFFLPMRRLGSYFHVAMNGMAASDKIFGFLKLDEPADGNGELDSIEKLELCNVSFSYNEEREILHGVNIEIPENSFVGIVGESGCGKSTAASLLMRRGTASSGSVRIGGRDIKEISGKSLMKNIAYIGHSSLFFKGTVRENLLLASPGAEDERLFEVLERCGLSGFLKEQDGLDTFLTENAGNLSGGQKQRLALVRALLSDPKVFIFDEATSSIDVESEETILSQIHAMKGSKTIIMISHRLMNVADADCIYAMEHGNIAEYGTHGELLKNGGVYSALWKRQRELESYGIKDKTEGSGEAV